MRCPALPAHASMVLAESSVPRSGAAVPCCDIRYVAHARCVTERPPVCLPCAVLCMLAAAAACPAFGPCGWPAPSVPLCAGGGSQMPQVPRPFSLFVSQFFVQAGLACLLTPVSRRQLPADCYLEALWPELPQHSLRPAVVSGLGPGCRRHPLTHDSCHAIISALRWQRSSCPVAHLQYK